MNLGITIKKIRTSKGYNQTEFCKGIGITQSYLSGIENGNKTPSIELLKNISEFVNIPIPVLFWFTIDKKDVHKTKEEIFNILKPSIDNLIINLFDLNQIDQEYINQIEVKQ